MKVEKIMKQWVNLINKNGLCMYKCPCSKPRCNMYENFKLMVIDIIELRKDFKKELGGKK